MREPAHQVDPSAKKLWATSAALGEVFPLVGIGAWVFFDGSHRGWQLAAALALLVVGAAYIAVVPAWRYRVHRWEVTADAVYTQTGWWSQERRLAPISRIQTVDSEFGPLERLFGLGTVTVTTASAAGPLKVAGLARADVDRIVADLTSITARDSGDAT